MMIAIVSSHSDVHARCVARHIEKLGHVAAIIDPALAGEGAAFSFSACTAMLPEISYYSPEGRIDLSGYDAVWLRRHRKPHVHRNIISKHDRAFARREWDNLMNGLYASFSGAVISPHHAQTAASKPRQLSAAAQCGLLIPETLITSHPADAEAFIDKYEGNVMTKSMTPHAGRSMYTVRWSEGRAKDLKRLPVAPAIFQHAIAGVFDVRLTVIGDRCFAARVPIETNDVDCRHLRDRPYQAFDLPSEVQDRILGLMNNLELEFGCLDLRLTEAGEYYFFEVNPQGQFLFIEIWTGIPIARTLAEFLVSASLRKTVRATSGAKGAGTACS